MKHLSDCQYYTDNWEAFAKVLPAERHHIGKSGTATVERDNSNTRHHLGRFTHGGQCHEVMDCFDRPRGLPSVSEDCLIYLCVNTLYAEWQSVGEFPGFKAVNLTKAQLELIVHRAPESWRTALSNVAGVYLISDTITGRFYVSSAYGEGGIWHRWSAYANSGHGGNVELKELLADEGVEYAENLRYSILEISDLHDSQDSILKRESHWKDILMSRIYGLNAN